MSTSTNVSSSDGQSLVNVTLESCAGKFEDYSSPKHTVYCNWTFDSILCWPPTRGGEMATQNCPSFIKGFDTTKHANRLCSINGTWEGKHGVVQTNNHGWTNFSNCVVPEIKDLLERLGNDSATKINIAQRTRTLEICGLSISLIALLISLAIFYRFRSLRNNRTKIHKNLFIAIVIQVVIRLTLYIDQAIIRSSGQENETSNTARYSIDNTPYLCEAAYILLEYARTAMFLWMFIEGLYLHNLVTVTVFQGRFPHLVYAAMGWGAPVVMTAIWAGFTANAKLNQKCWFGYNLTPYYWILEGPRLIVILLNFIFLLNIIRVLVVKLRQSHTSDVEQVRKAVRAAFVLLPLLGITNLLNMTEAPLDRPALVFALWSYTTHFFTSFQGFFIATIYCFLNGEVRTALLKSISVYMSLRGHHDWAIRRPSYSVNHATNAETEQPLPRHNGNDASRHREQQHLPPQRYRSNWINLFFMPKQINQIQQDQPPESVVFDISD